MSRPARLTGDLLARKGQAMPASGLRQPMIAWTPAWRSEMEPPATGAVGAVIPLSRRASPLPVCEVDDGGRPVGTAAGATPPNGAARVALTLRLDRVRHTRLRIFAARHQATNQDVLIRALDAYMRSCGDDCPCLTAIADDVADD